MVQIELPRSPVRWGPNHPLMSQGTADYVVRPARASDLVFFKSLADGHRFELGFLPESIILQRLEMGHGLIALWNGEPCGLLLTNGLKDHARVLYTCIRHDARRRTHGLVLVGEYAKRLVAAGSHVLTLRCREDLEANEFWGAGGFGWAGDLDSGNKSGLVLRLWYLHLQPDGWLFDSAVESLARVPDGELPVFEKKMAIHVGRQIIDGKQNLLWPGACPEKPADGVILDAWGERAVALKKTDDKI